MAHLREFGQQLIDNGYKIVPIKYGEKRPSIEKWPEVNADKIVLDSWLKQNWLRDAGVGILTKHTPAIDIDVGDADVVRELYLSIRSLLGTDLPYRIGRAPRLILLTRTDEPFSKLRSKKYALPTGETTQVEILCDGQQFAAYHTHPDTLRDYAWPIKGPADIAAVELPKINREIAQIIIGSFETIAEQQVSLGLWHVVQSQNQAAAPNSDRAETYLLQHNESKQIDASQIAAALDGLSAADYDRWLAVGMALHHQFDGADEGYALWDQWSKTNGGVYAGPDDTRYRWDRFSAHKTNPVTIHSLFKWADDARLEQSDAALQHIEKTINECASYSTLMTGSVKTAANTFVDQFPLLYEKVLDLVKRRAKVLTGAPVSIETVRKVIKRRAVLTEVTDGNVAHPWCDGWVYVTEEDKFFNLDVKESLTRQAFDAAFNRILGSDGEGEFVSAARIALEQAQIPIVRGVRYMPGAEPLFEQDKQRFANRYRSDLGAPMPDVLTHADRAAFALLGEHIRNLIPEPTDQRVFLDYLTYCIQFPGKKINWVILLQGQEGDGKTYFAQLCARMLGADNVRMISGEALKGQFTGWADSGHMGFIEEIKLHGHSGYETLNKIKPYLTNATVPIRRMRQEEYQVPNVMNHILFTNFRDAVPLEETDTRYYVIFSRWGNRSAFDAWRAANPGFFARLYGDLDSHAGAFRKFFMEREISADFRPKDRAPVGGDKAEMAQLSRDDYSTHIDDILEQKGGVFGKNSELMSATWLLSEWNFDSSAPEKPYGKRLVTVLLRAGWLPVKLDSWENRLFVDGIRHRMWTKNAQALTDKFGIGWFPSALAESVRGTYSAGAEFGPMVDNRDDYSKE
jgi:hypothetical protein